MRYTRMLAKLLAFARRHKVGMLGMSLLSLLLLDPGRAQALSLTVHFAPSTVSFFSGQYPYANNTPFEITQDGSTLSFEDLFFGSIATLGGHLDFVIQSQPTGTLNANGSYTTSPFNVQINNFVGAVLQSTATIPFFLTTEDFSRAASGSCPGVLVTDGARLGSPMPNAFPGNFALMGSVCVTTLGQVEDSPFTVKLQGTLPPVVLPEPYLAVLLGIALFALAIPARARRS